MKNLKQITSFALSLMLAACVDPYQEELPSLDAQSLAQLLVKEPLYDKYTAAVASNFALFLNISDHDKITLARFRDQLKQDQSAIHASEIVQLARSIGFDFGVLDHHSTLLRRFSSAYRFQLADFQSVLRNGVRARIAEKRRERSNAIPIGQGCTGECDAMADAVYDGQIAAATSDMERTLLNIGKSSYFSGCFEYCMRHPH